MAIKFGADYVATGSMENRRCRNSNSSSAVHSQPARRLKFRLADEHRARRHVRFGGRDILLREILELSAGSVLELDREVQDPADLLLDGKLIARGEVVVVDGNFGMRIIEVCAGPQLSA